MERWLALLQKWFFNRWEPEEQLFDGIDLHTFLEKAMTIVLEKSKVHQVTWIDSVELKQLNAHSKGLVYEKAPNLDTKMLVLSTDTNQSTSLASQLSSFDLSSGVAQVNSGLIYIPVCHHKDHSIIGAFLLNKVTDGREKQVSKDVSLFVNRISKHLGFCVELNQAKGETFLDDLTGLHNQKFMNMVLDTEIHRSARNKVRFSVLFMDIDYFKSVNDTKGHWVGSRLLVELSRIIKSLTRRSDYCFRYGGDEFVVILPDTDQQGAMIAAERLRKKVEGTEFLIDGVSMNLTLSIGIATYPDHAQSHKEIIQMADQAMYSGKHKSRNIVFLAG